MYTASGSPRSITEVLKRIWQNLLYPHREIDEHILARLNRLDAKGALIMATTKQLVDMANAAAAEVAKFAPAVNALEAAITAALAKIPSIPADAQADIDAAVATLQGVVTSAQAAVADAADGVDEAAATPAPAETPAEPPADTPPA